MDKTIELAGKDLCTGCGACKAVCPKSAVSFVPDAEGFPSPVVDEEKCVRCGLCAKTCPALSRPVMSEIKSAYAAQIKDREILKDSTSGGVFTALSRGIFGLGGVVYGCVWDEAYNAVVQRAVNEEEIKSMRGSKYVWSWAGDAFPQVKADLNAGRIVLFTGMPCQVAGLKSYLGKDYDNLITLDFLCSGAPSPLALKSYIKTIAPTGQPADLNLKFRDKNPHGVGVHITYKGKASSSRSEHISNPYYYSFYTRLVDRLSCFNCPYGTEKRVSDLTAGDYWGVANYHKEMDVRAGISALMINMEKGNKYIELIGNGIELEETTIEHISKANNLSVGAVKHRVKPVNREAFLSSIATNGWIESERKYLRNTARLKQRIKQKIPAKLMRFLKR